MDSPKNDPDWTPKASEEIRIQNEPIVADSDEEDVVVVEQNKSEPVLEDAQLRPFDSYVRFSSYCCRFCTREWSSKAELERHEKDCQVISEQEILQDGDVFICPRCFKTFAIKVLCISHVHSHDSRAKVIARLKEKKLKTPLGEPLQCPECTKKFASQRTLDRHVQMHTAMRKGTYKCKICGQHFRVNKELINHSLSAHGKFQMAGGSEPTSKPKIPARTDKFDALPKKAAFRSKAKTNWQRREWKDD